MEGVAFYYQRSVKQIPESVWPFAVYAVVIGKGYLFSADVEALLNGETCKIFVVTISEELSDNRRFFVDIFSEIEIFPFSFSLVFRQIEIIPDHFHHRIGFHHAVIAPAVKTERRGGLIYGIFAFQIIE